MLRVLVLEFERLGNSHLGSGCCCYCNYLNIPSVNELALKMFHSRNQQLGNISKDAQIL